MVFRNIRGQRLSSDNTNMSDTQTIQYLLQTIKKYKHSVEALIVHCDQLELNYKKTDMIIFKTNKIPQGNAQVNGTNLKKMNHFLK